MHGIYFKRLALEYKFTTPIEANVNFWSKNSRVYDDVKQYMRIIGKFIYLTLTRPEISFTIGLFS